MCKDGTITCNRCLNHIFMDYFKQYFIFYTRANPISNTSISATTTTTPMTLTAISAIADKPINGLVFNRNDWEFDERSQTDHRNYPTARPVIDRISKPPCASMKINQQTTQLTASGLKKKIQFLKMHVQSVHSE